MVFVKQIKATLHSVEATMSSQNIQSIVPSSESLSMHHNAEPPTPQAGARSGESEATPTGPSQTSTDTIEELRRKLSQAEARLEQSDARIKALEQDKQVLKAKYQTVEMEGRSLRVRLEGAKPALNVPGRLFIPGVPAMASLTSTHIEF